MAKKIQDFSNKKCQMKKLREFKKKKNKKVSTDSELFNSARNGKKKISAENGSFRREWRLKLPKPKNTPVLS